MNGNVPTVSEIVRELPTSFRGRFDSLGQYVQALVREIRGQDAPPLSAKRLSFIHLIVFIYLLKRYLEEGTKAAERAVKASHEFGFESFSVGRTVFAKGNDNTLRGRRLADLLISSIDEPSIVKALEESNNVRSLVRKLLYRTRRFDG